jgi:large subunit ribosomal protein L17
MLRNLAANLITHERIETTEAKAKELRRITERLISKAKRLGAAAYTPQDKLGPAEKAQRLHASRLLGAYLPRWGVKTDGTKIDIVEKVLIDLSKRFSERPGGYTRTAKLGPRRGDGAQMSIIEFVDTPEPEDKQRPVPETVTAAEPAAAAAAG